MDATCLIQSRARPGFVFQPLAWWLLLVAIVFACALNSKVAWAQPAAKANDKPVITLAADPWCPYNCLPTDLRPGYMIDIAKAAFSAEGYQVRYRIGPWSRIMGETHAGIIDGAVGATRQNGHGLVFGKHPLGVDHTVIGVTAGRALHYQRPHSLDGLRIGVIADYGYDNGGRIDQYLVARARNNPRSITVIASANALPQLAQLLDQGLNALRKSGRLEAILAPYGIQDWQPMLNWTHESKNEADPNLPIL